MANHQMAETGFIEIAPSLAAWDTEVCVLAADSRTALLVQIQKLRQFVQENSTVNLKDLSYTLNVPLHSGPYCLALVTNSTSDLQHKLERAQSQLADSKRRRIKDSRGIYFFEDQLAVGGELAFLFPGEGSQYENMLQDLRPFFPEVQANIDAIKQEHNEHSSEVSFQAGDAAQPARDLQSAIRAILAADSALLDLLGRLKLQPDAVAGHSVGELVALIATGMIDRSNNTPARQIWTELARIPEQALAEGEVPSVALVAVGADQASVAAIIEQIDGDMYLAMDNCPHQSVIVGEDHIMERAVEQLRRRGFICERLPFTRPYHTPLFEPYAGALRAFFDRWLISTPRYRTYSCASGHPFPANIEETRELAAAQWMRPVVFRKMIESMYADGVRIFVEVGPRSNLTGFVDDILRDRSHLAVPANVTSRPGVTQINHLVALLAAHGVPMQLDHLYARRSATRLPLDWMDNRGNASRAFPHAALEKRDTPVQAITSTMPPVAENGEHKQSGVITEIEYQHHQPSAQGTAKPSSVEVVPAVNHPPEPVVKGDQSHQAMLYSHVQPPSAGQVMTAYFQTMQQFLNTQQEIMQAFLAGRKEHPAVFEHAQTHTQNVPSVQRAMSEPEPALAQASHQITPPEQLQPRQDHEVVPATVLSHSQFNSVAIGDMLLRLVGERTGYPREMLDLNLDLEADLGIDSIKRVEILGALQQAGAIHSEEIEQLSSCRSLREMIDLLADRNGNGTSVQSSSSASVSNPQPLPKLPFIGTIVSLTPGEELVALREINIEEDLFLRDHAFGCDISALDPTLTGLPVVPFTVSIEMLAEAAAMLAPERRVVGIRNIRGHRWIALDWGKLTLKLTARRVTSASSYEVHVQIYEEPPAGQAAQSPAAEGIVILEERYQEPPLAEAFPLQDARSSRWTPEQLYQGKGMFHGPTFQGVVSMDQLGEDGAIATLQALPPDHLFRSQADPHFIIDPVLLDQTGQAVGFWGIERLQARSAMFPYALESIQLYRPQPQPYERVTCQARIRLVGHQQVRSDVDLVGTDERLYMRLTGAEKWRFDMPPSFRNFLLVSARDYMLSERWSLPLASLGGTDLQAYRFQLDTYPDTFFTGSSGIWQRALAHAVLNRREREQWQQLRTPAPRRLEWLLGRVVAKDAARQYLKEHYGLLLCPADIEIQADEDGRPRLCGTWTDQLPAIPIISLSHTAGTAVALIGDSRDWAGIGIDIELLDHMNEDVAHAAFTPGEQERLTANDLDEHDAWPLRAWCAKEAVVKALGTGTSGPRSLVVQSLDPRSGTMELTLAREPDQLTDNSVNSDVALVAFTGREGNLIVAASFIQLTQEKEHEENT